MGSSSQKPLLYGGEAILQGNLGQNSFTAMKKALHQLLQTLDNSYCCQGLYNPLLGSGDNYFFTWGQVGLDFLGGLHNMNWHWKTAFYIFLGCFCVILKWESGRGANTFSWLCRWRDRELDGRFWLLVTFSVLLLSYPKLFYLFIYS